MHSLRVIYDTDGWAWHHQALGLQANAPSDFHVTIVGRANHDSLASCLGDEPPTLLLVYGDGKPRIIGKYIKHKRWPTRQVVRWTTGWPSRLSRLEEVRGSADFILFNNRQYWDLAGRLPSTAYVPNGVDLDIFEIRRAIQVRRPKVLWCGSVRNGGNKGYKEILLPLRSNLAKRSIECDFRLIGSYGANKMTPAQMADWYNGGTILVCASETEGTPNTALEAAACGCTIVSTPVGNMPEIIRNGENGYLVDRDVEALLDGIVRAIGNYPRLAQALQADILKWGWRTRAPDFFEVLRRIAIGVTEPLTIP